MQDNKIQDNTMQNNKMQDIEMQDIEMQDNKIQDNKILVLEDKLGINQVTFSHLVVTKPFPSFDCSKVELELKDLFRFYSGYIQNML